MIFMLRIAFSLCSAMITSYGVPDEYRHCFIVFDEISEGESIGLKNISKDLYEIAEIE